MKTEARTEGWEARTPGGGRMRLRGDAHLSSEVIKEPQGGIYEPPMDIYEPQGAKKSPWRALIGRDAHAWGARSLEGGAHLSPKEHKRAPRGIKEPRGA
jgi:hypothetical protein